MCLRFSRVLADETRWRILPEIAAELQSLGRRWDRRLEAIKRIAEAGD